MNKIQHFYKYKIRYSITCFCFFILIALIFYPDFVFSCLDNIYHKYSQYRERILHNRDWQFVALLATVFGVTGIGILQGNFFKREKQKEARKIEHLILREKEVSENLKKMRGEFARTRDDLLLREINYYEKKLRDIQDELKLFIDHK